MFSTRIQTTRIYSQLITALLLISITACGQAPGNTPTKSPGTGRDYPSYITFGVFCGECSRHCATMYQYNMMGNINTLFVDSTDSYFKNKGKVVCATRVTGDAKYQAVNRLVQQIPTAFMQPGGTGQTFGCPDCLDGCGVYFELGGYGVAKKYYIDYHLADADKEVKAFNELVKATLAQLKKRE